MTYTAVLRYGTYCRIIGSDDVKKFILYFHIFPLYPDIEPQSNVVRINPL